MCGATDCAASRLDAAVTAETMMSELATASAAEDASRAPILSPACFSRAPSFRGNRMSQAAMLLDAGFAQAGGDRLAGFAETDEAEAGLVAGRLGSVQLALHTVVEALDVDDDAGMASVADPLLIVERLDAKLDGAPLDPGDDGGRAQPHPDRRRRIVADVEMRAEALMAGRQQGFDRIEGGGFHQVDHHRRCQHVHAAAADARRGMLPRRRSLSPRRSGPVSVRSDQAFPLFFACREA